ncbi:hypothetical protein [Nocardioides abyssi]|uniref:Uncharacterized protein n=1 Tax=Nocardioides abyssi TaxID=3058370 RepID=A0ABT8EY18_9ACTN|nr:hypothetical protein [Nocardioides abyssi]MDN4162979.1 hypothetical protein [Nocardioides abyssi]
MDAQHDLDTTTPLTPNPATNPAPEAAMATRGWKERLTRGRTPALAAATAAALVIGGAGFGIGYAVADPAGDGTNPSQVTGTGQDDPRFGGPPDGRMGGPGEPMGGQMGGSTDGESDPGSGDTGQAPDLDGDGQPDASTSVPDDSEQQS